MNELMNARDQAVQQSLANMEFHPVFVEDLAIAQYTKIPLSAAISRQDI